MKSARTVVLWSVVAYLPACGADPSSTESTETGGAATTSNDGGSGSSSIAPGGRPGAFAGGTGQNEGALAGGELGGGGSPLATGQGGSVTAGTGQTAGTAGGGGSGGAATSGPGTGASTTGATSTSATAGTGTGVTGSAGTDTTGGSPQGGTTAGGTGAGAHDSGAAATAGASQGGDANDATGGVATGEGGNAGSGGSNAGATSTGGSNDGSGGAAGGATGGTGPLGECDPYVWPAYSPDLDYSFRDDFPDIDPSTFTLYPGCDSSVVAGTKTSGWWAFVWGPNRNPSISDEDIDQVLAGLNEDLGYARDVMGWPPDKGPKNGHYSAVYLYGSGLCTDSASNTETGGWQSSVAGYPIVLLSYYPVVNYDRGGITHEAIHAVLADMPGGQKAAWFNEGGNTWLQMNMNADRTGDYGVGFLDGAPFLAPHMPIECYSGWLQDGSFGGPSAEGVNQYRDGQQISTWRDYLGGNQYNAAFPHFLALYVSTGVNAWIWNNPSHVNILETLADGLGEEQIRRLVMEYRARQAMVDFGPWSEGFKVPIGDNWGRVIGAEEIAGGIAQEPTPYVASFYAQTTNENGTLRPNEETLPGWSGANQIPLTVSGDTVRLEFQPIGENMRLQLAYRAADGSAVYGQPVESGATCLRLDKDPKNGVVVAVVSNVDYVYEGDETRSRKYDYRLRLLDGVSSTASTTEKWFE